MNSASTHIYRLTSICSVSIRSYKAERLRFILEKNMKESRKEQKTKKRHRLFLPPELLAGCGDPVLSMSLGALPALGGCWAPVGEGGQEGNQLKRGGG